MLPASGSQQGEFELVLHGYFRQTLTGPDGVTYTRFDFPGLGLVDQTGAPELPALRPTLALPTSASAAQLTGLSVAPGGLITLSARVYPQPEPALDDGDPGAGDPDGTPEQFSIDGALYSSFGPWPAQQASAAAAPGLLLSGARGARPELFPVRFDPALNRVLIARRTRYTYAHVGASSSTPLSRDQRRLLSLEAVNFSAVSGLYPEAGPYLGRYAIVAPAAFAPALAPWIEHRRATGFEVALLPLESLPGSGAAAIRAGLAAWSAAGPASAERYALLVGDAQLLPPASAPTPGAPPSDDPYGSPSGSPQGTESIFVGRWPVDDAGQIPALIARQIAYELDKDPGHDYGRLTLATHQAGAPGGFQAEAQALLAGSYAAPLGFSTQFGSQASSSDQAVLGQLAQGRGLLCYRGHGTSNGWTQFGVVGGDLGTLHKDDLAALSTPFAPVVWSLSCHQGAIDLGDSLGETWLLAKAGALAHYGAARATQNRGNRRLLRDLFELAFEAGLRTQGPLLALAEERLAAALPKSPDGWRYGLLGCPATRLRAAPPRPLDLLLPSVVPLCSGACPQVVGVVDALGAPVPNVLVSAYKPPFDPALPTELLVAFQAGPSGPVSIPLGPQTLGTINVTGRDDDGNVAQEVVQAKSGAFTKLGQGTPGTQGAPRFDPAAELDEAPVASIDLDPFLLSKYELTQGQWLCLTGQNPSERRSGPEFPVDRVHWLAAREVLRRLELELPSEVQWEYAARAGSESVFLRGDRPADLAGQANLADAFARDNGGSPGWTISAEVSDGFTLHAPVGSFAPNAFGLCDMLGNLWEWVDDRYLPYDLPARPGDGRRLPPEPAPSPEDTGIVARGGSYMNAAPLLRVSERYRTSPTNESRSTGIRPGRPVR